MRALGCNRAGVILDRGVYTQQLLRAREAKAVVSPGFCSVLCLLQTRRPVSLSARPEGKYHES